MITFKQQFDKLTEAYIRGEVYPYEPCACFVGNLLNRTSDWCTRGGIIWKELYFHDESSEEQMKRAVLRESGGFYTIHEIHLLEQTFLMNIRTNREWNEPLYEEQLFKAFEKTLDLLKQIHESKGEIVEPFQFTKRQPQNELI